MSGFQVIVRSRENNELIHVVPKTLTRAKMMHYSQFVARNLPVSTNGEHSNSFVLRSTPVDPTAMRRVLQWVAGNNIANPSLLAAKALGIDDILPQDFKNLVAAYHAINAISIDRHFRIDDLRENIIFCVKMAPLGLDEFAMVIEMTSFDPTISDLAKDGTMYRYIKDGVKRGVPEMQKIEEYCKVNRLWEEMVATGERIKQTRAEQTRRQAAEN